MICKDAYCQKLLSSLLETQMPCSLLLDAQEAALNFTPPVRTPGDDGPGFLAYRRL